MSENPTIQFNINEYIRVKFSPASLRRWKERARRMQHAFPKMADSFPLKPRVDDAGYYRGQFWSIMCLVAPELQAGHSAFEECLIEFEAPELAREVERRRKAEEALSSIEADASMLEAAISARDPVRELMIRAGDIRRLAQRAMT